MVAVSPAVPPVNDMVGVVSFVTLSVPDEPVSLAGSRSGAAGAAGGAVSMTSGVGTDDGDTLPAGSVIVAVEDQLPGVKLGRSHEVADPTV